MKKKLFVPFDVGELEKSSGVDYLNEIIWLLIEQVNRLEEEIKKLK